MMIVLDRSVLKPFRSAASVLTSWNRRFYRCSSYVSCDNMSCSFVARLTFRAQNSGYPRKLHLALHRILSQPLPKIHTAREHSVFFFSCLFPFCYVSRCHASMYIPFLFLHPSPIPGSYYLCIHDCMTSHESVYPNCKDICHILFTMPLREGRRTDERASLDGADWFDRFMSMSFRRIFSEGRSSPAVHSPFASTSL